MKIIYKLAKRANRLIYHNRFEKKYYVKAYPSVPRKAKFSLPFFPFKIKPSLVPIIIGLLVALSVGGLLIKYNRGTAPNVKAFDLTLSPAPLSSNYLYQNITNGFKVYLGDQLQEGKPKVKFEQDNSSAEFSLAQLPNQNAQFENQDNKAAVYKNVFLGIDIKYFLTEKGVKEEIIIGNQKSGIRNQEFQFNLSLKNAVPRKALGGKVSAYFLDPVDGQYRFHIPQPFMIDAKGARSTEVELRLVKQSDLQGPTTYQITLIPSQEWLNHPARQYPVIIDPSVVHDESSEFATGAFNRIEDAGSGASPKLRLPYHELPADEHTVGLWHMNETLENSCSGSEDACDSSGNGNHGTATGTTITTTNQKLGAAARDFNGSSDAIDMGDQSELEGFDFLTIETWIKADTLGGGQKFIAGKERVYKIDVSPDGRIRFLTGDGSGWWSTGGISTFSNTISTGTWYHIAATYDGATKKVYINGVLDPTIVGVSNTFGSGTRKFTLGAYDNGAGFSDYFDGIIDEVRISNIARSPEEIRQDAQRFPYGVYTSDTIDLGSQIGTIDTISWTDSITPPTAPSGWTKYKPVIIDNTQNSNTLTNYQVKVNVDYNSDMQSDFDDLRFTNSSGTNLDYWIEEKTDGVEATVWVEVNSITASDLTTIFMWYGKGDASAGSDIGDTFDFGDDFPGASLDGTKWPNTAGSPVVSGGNLELNIGAGVETVRSNSSFSRPYIVEYRARISNTATGFTTRAGFSNSSAGTLFYADDDAYWFDDNATTGRHTRTHNEGTMENFDDLVSEDTSFHKYKVVWTSSDAAFYFNDTIKATHTTQIPDESCYVRLEEQYNTVSATYYTDWVFVRKYASPEPVIGVGADIEFQTRTSANGTSWEAWKPTTNETQILSMDSDASSWSTSNSDMLTKSDESTIKMQANGSLKSTVGAPQVDGNTAALWHLEETSGSGAYILDETTNNNDGTPNGTTIAEGFFGKARSFNGSSDYVNIPDNATIDVTQITVEAWVKTSTTTQGARVVSKWGDTAAEQAYILVVGWSGVSGRPRFAVGTPGIDVADSPVLVNDNTWHHLAGTYNGSMVRIYVDGKETASTAASGNITNGTGALRLGVEGDGSGAGYYSGIIDEVRVSDTARSAEDIAEAYRAGRDHRLSRTISSTDLSGKTKVPFYFAGDKQGTIAETYIGETDHSVYASDANTEGLWHLDEEPNFPESVKDSSGNGNHGLPGPIEFDTFESGVDGWSYRDGNWSTPTQDCATSSVGSCSVKMTDTDGGAGSNYITTKSYSSSDTMFDIRYKCESGALWGFMLYNGSTWSCIKGSGTTGCGASYNPIGALTPSVVCDNTWRQATYDLGAGWSGQTISQTIIGDWNAQAANKWMWFDQFQIYHDSETPGTQGKIGGARYFDGSNDYIEVPDDNSLDITGSHTLEAWIYPTVGDTTIINKPTDAWGNVWFFALLPTDNLRFIINENTFDSTREIIYNQWSHVAAVFDDSGDDIIFYINGEGETAQTYTGSGGTSSKNLYIGVDRDGEANYNQYWNGIIDEVRISNTNRSADTIRQAYQYGLRTHQINVDYKSTCSSDGPTSTSDLQFTPDTTTELYKGDTVIVRENYNGTLYIMQGEVTSISSGLVTVASWSGTAPSGGYSTNADVFKWQREYWDVTDVSPNDRNATVRLGMRVLDASEGFVMYLDDFRHNTNYLTDPSGSTITSTANRYIQYRAFLTTNNTLVTPQLDSVTIDYDQTPSAPTELEAEGQTNPIDVTDTTPEFSAVYNDLDVGDIANKYRIQVDDDPAFGSTIWDSGASGASMTNCDEGTRCQLIPYGGASTDLQWGTKYYWQIKYWDDDGNEGDWSTETAFFIMKPIYSPSHCALDDGDQPGEITVIWEDATTLETGYRIERNVNAGGFAFLTNKAADSTSHLDNGTSAENTYQYRIRAESNNGNSSWCTTSTVNFAEGNFKFEGVQLEGLMLE